MGGEGKQGRGTGGEEGGTAVGDVKDMKKFN